MNMTNDNQTTGGSPSCDAACSPVFSDTPETDNVAERLGRIWERFKLAVHSAPIAYASEPTIVPSDFARQLERERDEARATLRDVLIALDAMDHEGPRLAALRVKSERDEARSIAERFRTYVPKESVVPLFITWENDKILP